MTTIFQEVETCSTLTCDSIGIGYCFSERVQPDKTYQLSQANPAFNIIITKIDTVTKIMPGEFSGKLFRRISDTAFASSYTDSIILKDGGFDISLK